VNFYFEISGVRHVLHEKRKDEINGLLASSSALTLSDLEKPSTAEVQPTADQKKSIGQRSNSGEYLNLDMFSALSCIETVSVLDLHIFVKRATQFIPSRRQLIDFFRVYFHAAILLVTNAAKPSKQVQQCKDKENVSVNTNNNRAIIAVAMIKNPQPVTKKQSILKHVLKKSTAVPPPPSAASTSSHVSKKPTSGNAAIKENKPVAHQGFVRKTLTVPIGQRQFEYAESIKKRKEELARKAKEEEDKALRYNFHANPAPKFGKSVFVSRQASVETRDKKITKQASLPLIPLSKRASKENLVPNCGDPERIKYRDEKKKMLIAKYQEPKVQFRAKPAAVLKKQPFQPVHNIFKTAEPKPFRLHITDRMLMRSEFDKKLHETIAIRKLHEDIRKQAQDQQERKFMRQKTEFRARANPFRNYH
jgi:hypothetical protein